ncbi:MAG TPA: ABC transporter ATP-binding protein [Casimicrobiaceae bacterium]
MSRHAVVQLAEVGKSYRSYSSTWWRIGGWLTGRPTRYADHWVLRNVTASVHAGESIGVVGRNGAGKTTLLKLIAGTLQPTEGSLSVAGRVSAILELGMGFNPEFTGQQNARHACGLLGYNSTAIGEALPWIREFADVGSYFDEPVRTYSSGMAMRLAFAVATATRPDILIVDEALSVGDLSFQAKCFERIREFRDAGTTLLYVTHAVADVVKHCERAWLVRGGRLVLDGPARQVTNQYLDELFGRQARAGEPERASDAAPARSPFHDTEVDAFETRPGYRKDEHRWGDGGARIVDYHVAAAGEDYPSEVTSQDTVRISFKVRFERRVDSPVYGLLIKTLEGLFVYGTNSSIAARGATASVEDGGGVVIAQFSVRLRLNAGAYLLSLGVSDDVGNGELVPLDRRYDAILITVRHTVPISGLVDLQATFDALPVASGAMA